MAAYALSIVMSVVSGVLLAIVKQLIDDNKKLKTDQQRKTQAMQDGMMLLLKIQLIEYHDKYMNEDSIPTYVYDNFDEMYKAYEELGGNGMVKHMKEAVDKKKIVNSKG